MTTIELNPQQKAAVETESKRALVLAGAGSGKTRVLTERIAHLIENKKVSPYEIMAITFTRKAAGEMRERLETRLGKTAWGIEVGTMHAFALKMLHRFGDQVGIRPNTTVYSEWEESFIVRDVAQALGVLKGKSWKIPKKEIDAMFRAYYQTGEEPEKDSPGYKVFKGVISRFRENNALSYGALLIGLEALLPALKKYLSLRYVFVDEIQDNDALQWSIVDEMCRLFGASLFVVGDVDQSIFEWRGACPGYLVEHQSDFDIYRLQNNYRSGRNIVEAANRLIRNNENRIENSMEPVKDEGHISTIKNMDSDKIAFILSNVEKTKPDAILCRIHKPLDKLSSLLAEKGVIHNCVGQKSKLSNSEPFIRFHAFLKLIVNPIDNFAFLLVKDMIGLSGGEYHSIRFNAAVNMQSHFNTYLSMHGDSKWVKDFFSMGYSEDGGECLDILINLLGNDPDFAMAHNFAIENLPNDGKLQSYLDWLATYDIQDDIEEKDDRIQLMTIHAAKGLEWPTVMIIGCNEGILPSKQAVNNGEIEAERRLFYVAMTRAEENLILAVRPESTTYGEKTYESPKSRFLKEM